MSLKPLPSDTNLATFSHLKVGGTAKAVYAPSSLSEMRQLLPLLDASNTVFMAGGSNLLLPPHTNRVVVLDRDMPAEMNFGGAFLHATAPSLIKHVVQEAMSMGLGGLEFLAGLPAHLGGLLSMNAGAWGKRIGAFVREVTVIGWDGSLISLRGEDVEWGYRKTSLNGYIAAVTFELIPGDIEDIRATVRAAIEKRACLHPMHLPSLGCFFKNPEGGSAGKLIDECGLKGLRVGDAMVSEQHANIIVNVGGATYYDYLGLAAKVRDIVRERTGVTLEPEVRVTPPAEGENPWT